MSSSEDEVKFTPTLNLDTNTDNNETNLLHLKSKENYEAAYQNFKTWREKQLFITDESCLLAYFESLSEKYKPTTLWAQYSMLKSTISINEKIDIGSFKEVTPLLKLKSQGFQSKRSNPFKPNEIQEFIARAPDEIYLATKVKLFFF